MRRFTADKAANLTGIVGPFTVVRSCECLNRVEVPLEISEFKGDVVFCVLTPYNGVLSIVSEFCPEVGGKRPLQNVSNY
jgi:hypothetical protein